MARRDWNTLAARLDHAPPRRPKGWTVAFDNMETRGPLVGTVEWQDRSIVLDVPAESTSVNVGFYLRGSGSVWARSVRLDAVDASVPVTTDVDPSLSAPTNLDFADVA